MVFYAQLDPAVISRAYENQPYGYQCLIAMLRGFIQNCCIIDGNGEVSATLESHVRKLPRDSDGIMLGKIQKFLERHNRFVREAEEVDVVISESEEPIAVGGGRGRVEACSLATYQFTDFEHLRSSVAQGGETYCHAEFDSQEFLDRNFRKALRHAHWIQVCDGSLGQNFRDNYRFTVERFLQWLSATNVHQSECRVSFLCLAPTLKVDRDLPPNQRRIDEAKRAELTAFLGEFGAEVSFYQRLPHERFILTDQIAFEIGRGMDFLLAGGQNRDVSIATKNLRQVTTLFESYDWFLLPGAR